MSITYTVSGYRGIVGTTITPEIVIEIVSAYADMIRAKGGTRVILGRDGRASGLEFARIASETLITHGISVVDVGIAPTPTIFFLTREEQCDGAVIITASHNPSEYNGIKLANNKGFYLDPTERDEVNRRIQNKTDESVSSGLYLSIPELTDKHIAKVLANVDVAAIRAKRFRVVLDPVNSAGAAITPKLLEALGCEVNVIHGEQNGIFERYPEPLPKHLKDLGEAVLKYEAEIGFAQDPDADRLVVSDENGDVLSEHYSLALAIDTVLRTHQGDIVLNLATGSIVEELAARHGSKTFRTKIGEPNVVDGMLAHNAIVGGESSGGGGLIYPTINFARDSIAGIAIFLDMLARENKPMSSIINAMPKYYGHEERFPAGGNMEVCYQSLVDTLPGATITTIDGIRLDFPDRSWIMMRPSNTEPIVKVTGEAKEQKRLDDLFEGAKKAILGQFA